MSMHFIIILSDYFNHFSCWYRLCILFFQSVSGVLKSVSDDSDLSGYHTRSFRIYRKMLRFLLRCKKGMSSPFSFRDMCFYQKRHGKITPPVPFLWCYGRLPAIPLLFLSFLQKEEGIPSSHFMTFEIPSLFFYFRYFSGSFWERPRKNMNTDYSMISVTTPDPTVLPPSLIANLSPSSIAIGWISSIDIVTLSPGMHISVPSGSCSVPVISVVLK